MKLTDEELIAAIEGEEAQALDAASGQLAADRTEALARYRQEPFGNEVDGRSQIVDNSVRDQIEWIVPSLVRVYLGGDEIGKFEPRGPEDEEPAKTETEIVNFYISEKNDIFSHINATIRDALLLRNGYMVCFWDKRYDTMTETYTGLSDEEVTLLASDPEVEVVEHSAYPDPMAPAGMGMMPGAPVPGQLHDVKVERKTCEEYAAVESIPPDEVLVSRRHRWTSLSDVDFVQWRRRVTIGQLRAEGFKIPDDVPSYNEMSQEWNLRARFGEDVNDDDSTPDPTRRIIDFRDTYMRIDLRGEGTPQLWRIAYVAGTRAPVLKEEADIVPIAAFSPLTFPHSHVGTSVYDLISDMPKLFSAIKRNYVDGLFLATSGRVAADINRVNMDDLLISAPGRAVRTEGDPGSAIMSLIQPDVGPVALQGLEYFQGDVERRTGVTRYWAGLDANTLNKTATGIQQIQSAANQRIELIARTMASGFKDLFLIVHALACKHSTKPLQLKLNGKWVSINPREWKRRTDFTISVGLGTGTPEQQLQKLMMLGPLLQQSQAMGLSGPEEAYNYGAEVLKAAGYKNPDRFIKPPKMAPKMGPDGKPVMGPNGQPVMEPQMPPPQKPELVQAEEVKAKAGMEKAQLDAKAKVESDQQRFKMDYALQQSNDQRQAELDNRKFALEREKMDRDYALQVMKLEKELEFKVWEAQFNAGLQVGLKTSEFDHQIGVEKTKTGETALDAIKPLIGQLAEAAQRVVAPRKIIRGPDGRVAGVEQGGVVHKVERDADGRASGTTPIQ